jgi:hypothetical protein
LGGIFIGYGHMYFVGNTVNGVVLLPQTHGIYCGPGEHSRPVDCVVVFCVSLVASSAHGHREANGAV